jgi:ABC-type branched-subunit amino acid transport system ATPase component
VLQTGKVVLTGTAKELREDEMVRKAYLGES